MKSAYPELNGASATTKPPQPKKGTNNPPTPNVWIKTEKNIMREYKAKLRNRQKFNKGDRESLRQRN